MLVLTPVELATAKRFVGLHHRHNLPPLGWKFGVGVEQDGQLVGVAIASRPVARALDDGHTVEIVRTCTTGADNANSKLYGAVCRAAKALGYRRAITYTLASETGASLRAAGFQVDARLPARGGWDNGRPRYEVDLFGNARTPIDTPKVRWVRHLATAYQGLPT
jgi:hypothetical protein